MVVIEVPLETPVLAPTKVQSFLQDFWDVFPEGLSNHLPLLWDFQHAIDFVPRASLPNLPQYKMNLIEHAELQR